MPVSYGSTTRAVVPLSSDQIGKVQTKSAPKSSMTSFLRILVAVLEVGAMVGSAVAAPFTGGASLLIDVGIGVAGAAANLGISAAEGEISALGTAFDFGSAFIPAVGGIRSATRIGKAGAEITKESLDEALTKVAKETATNAMEKKSNQLIRKIGKAEERKAMLNEGIAAKRAKMVQRAQAKQRSIVAANDKIHKRASAFRNRWRTGTLKPQEKALVDIFGKQYGINRITDWGAKLTPLRGAAARSQIHAAGSIGQKGVSALSSKVTRVNREVIKWGEELANVASKYHTTMDEVMKSANELFEIFEHTKNYGIMQKLSTGSFMKQLEKETDNKFILDVLKERYGYAIRQQSYFGRLANQNTANRAASLAQLRDVEISLLEGSPSDAAIWQSLKSRLIQTTKTRDNIHWWNSKLAYRDSAQMIDDALSSMTPLGQEVVSRLGVSDPKDLLNLFSAFQRHTDSNAVVRFIKKAGSKDFNENWVQKAQMLSGDANDIGRYGPERAYQYLKGKIEAILEKSAFKKAWVSAKKVIKESANLQNAFERAGGVMIPGKSGQIPGNYLFGYKIIDRNPANGWHTVFLKFVKETTNNKKDVLIRATEHDLKMLQEEGVDYYWRVGKRKGWWISKGGKKVSTSLGTVSSSLSLFLSFVPIPALRNLLSIVTNFVENTSAMIKGNWHQEWWGKFERAFIRTAINRTARLATRVVLGGLYKQAYMAKVTPKLAEQASGIASRKGAEQVSNKVIASSKLDAFITMQTAKEFGRLESKALSRSNWLGRELQRFTSVALGTLETYDKSSGLFEFRTDSYGDRFGKKLLQTSIPTAIKSSTIRSSTRKFNAMGRPNPARQLIGARRNLGQITRIYGSTTPSGVVKPLRSFTTIKI